jgi:hypothetical protein
MAKCTICGHDDRIAIDYAVASGLSLRAVARRYKVSEDAVQRHAARHLSPEQRAAIALKLTARQGDIHSALLERGATVTETIAALQGPLWTLFLKATDIGDAKAASTISGRLLESLSLTAKITGELLPHAQTNTINVVLHPSYQALRGRLIEILDRFPEAKDAVIQAFEAAGAEAIVQARQQQPPGRLIEGHAERIADANA